MYYTYVIYSSYLDRYYVGSTNHVQRRLADHNRGKTSHTRQGRSWELKYVETYESRTEAVHRENEIKKRKSRKYIEKLISSAG